MIDSTQNQIYILDSLKINIDSWSFKKLHESHLFDRFFERPILIKLKTILVLNFYKIDYLQITVVPVFACTFWVDVTFKGLFHAFKILGNNLWLLGPAHCVYYELLKEDLKNFWCCYQRIIEANSLLNKHVDIYDGVSVITSG